MTNSIDVALPCADIFDREIADTEIAVSRISTPLGPMFAAVADNRLCLLEFADRKNLQSQFKRVGRLYNGNFSDSGHAVIEQVQIEVGEYIAGKRQHFGIPISLKGTQFQQQVWQELLSIEFGQTTNYESIAIRVGRPKAQRAVGRANGDNRIAIVIPCHRVIRRDGAISGYGGQIWRKQWLLENEAKLIGRL